jgi:hypothetical protein
MARTVEMIGLHPEEVRWIRVLTALLRHPDPAVPELARQALLYLQASAREGHSAAAAPIDHAS